MWILLCSNKNSAKCRRSHDKYGSLKPLLNATANLTGLNKRVLCRRWAAACRHCSCGDWGTLPNGSNAFHWRAEMMVLVPLEQHSLRESGADCSLQRGDFYALSHYQQTLSIRVRNASLIHRPHSALPLRAHSHLHRWPEPTRWRYHLDFLVSCCVVAALQLFGCRAQGKEGLHWETRCCSGPSVSEVEGSSVSYDR